MKKWLWLCLVIFNIAVVHAAPMTAEQRSVMQAGALWAKDVDTRNLDKITQLYDEKAYLYPTFDTMLSTHSQIREYFKHFFKHPGLKVVFNEQNIRLYGKTVAVNSGLYTFSYISYRGKDKKTVTIPARYTFVYILTDKGWQIVEHHSSVMPHHILS